MNHFGQEVFRLALVFQQAPKYHPKEMFWGSFDAKGTGGLINNPFMPTVPTFAVRETDVSKHKGGASGALLTPLRDDSALRALSSLRGLRGFLILYYIIFVQN